MKQYPEGIKEEVRHRIAAGETQKAISQETGISRYAIQSWCGLRPETKLRQIAPLPKGGPKKNKTMALSVFETRFTSHIRDFDHFITYLQQLCIMSRKDNNHILLMLS